MAGSTTDDLKGRVKEAAGELTGDDRAKTEGQRDRLGAKVKEAAEHTRDRVSDAADSAKDKVRDLVDEAKDAAGAR